MNQVLADKGKISEIFAPITLLEQVSDSQTDGCLQVSQGSVDWLIYFNQGKLTYATHSVDPFERLERHLRRLSHKIPTLTSEARTQARLKFESEEPSNLTLRADYQAICWLVDQQYINLVQASKLVKRLTKEVIELYILLQDGDYNFTHDYDNLPFFCHLDLLYLIEKCRKDLQAWQALSPKVWSLDQRPYFLSQDRARHTVDPALQKKLSKILKGFSFRQLAALLDLDELSLAQRLNPLILDGIILLRPPEHPFDQLPKFSRNSLNLSASTTADGQIIVKEDNNFTALSNTSLPQQNYKIACVDDSPAILREVQGFLDDYNYSVFTISDSAKALMEIIRIQPDLIILDICMPYIDGYDLCRLLRKHSLLKTKPIVMMTGNHGLLDRVKARITGATECITKPFTQSQLLKIIFKYLT
ncbi:MAG: response regulator [Xenococcaceae cyanobacterium]